MNITRSQSVNLQKLPISLVISQLKLNVWLRRASVSIDGGAVENGVGDSIGHGVNVGVRWQFHREKTSVADHQILIVCDSSRTIAALQFQPGDFELS